MPTGRGHGTQLVDSRRRATVLYSVAMFVKLTDVLNGKTP
jgi:hypothetical protein